YRASRFLAGSDLFRSRAFRTRGVRSRPGFRPGILEVPGRAGGRLESWQKWSFPVSPPGPDGGAPAGWRPVRKRRRISGFSLASGQVVARGPGPGGEPWCEVELTDVRTRGEDWWTLGFEATGPASLLRSALEAGPTRSG
ncbi:MAG: hypothetical protein ABR922_24930, partial [Streptosporangiaceae bacterium]